MEQCHTDGVTALDLWDEDHRSVICATPRHEYLVLDSNMTLGSNEQSRFFCATLQTERNSASVDDEHVYWPFEGEFWRDELGNYEYTLTKGCKDR